MTIDFSDIVKSWTRALNPTEKQKDLAKKRWDICMDCDSKKEIIKNKKWSYICLECGCKLDKKIFTDKISACPLNKWYLVERQHFNIKEKETLI